MEAHKIFSMSFAKVYPLYIQKAERKNRTKEEVDEIVSWLTGYSREELEGQIKKNVDLKTFFEEAPCICSFDKRSGMRCAGRRDRGPAYAENTISG